MRAEYPPVTTRRTRALRWFVRLVMALLLFGGITAMYVTHSTAPYRFTRLESVPHSSVAIVLGARVYSGGVPSPMLEDRLATALDLYRAGWVSRILVSGDHGTE